MVDGQGTIMTVIDGVRQVAHGIVLVIVVYVGNKLELFSSSSQTVVVIVVTDVVQVVVGVQVVQTVVGWTVGIEAVVVITVDSGIVIVLVGMRMPVVWSVGRRL